jgi:uncharacterized protein YfdQ (DUF2303 family)
MPTRRSRISDGKNNNKRKSENSERSEKSSFAFVFFQIKNKGWTGINNDNLKVG